MPSIADNIAAVKNEIAAICHEHQRDPATVALLAVSKTKPLQDVQAAMDAGHFAFGENYLQDAFSKISALDDPRLEWHFIGQIQSNKAKTIAQHFHWVHTVDRLKIAQQLAKHRPHNLPPLNICLQVKLGDEESKGGIQPNEVITLCEAIAPLSTLRLRGLMAIPPASIDEAEQRHYFAELNALSIRMTNAGFAVDTLSMGMSGDYTAAIAEGSTMVRVGTAIFGRRPTSSK